MYKLPFQSQQNISIQQQLGEAFQDVKAVRDSLGAVEELALVGSGILVELSENTEVLKNVHENMEAVNNASSILEDFELLKEENKLVLAALNAQYTNVNLVLGHKYKFGVVFSDLDAFDLLLGKVYKKEATEEEENFISSINLKLGLIT